MSVSRAASLNQPNYVLRALRAPSIVPSIQLSPAEAAHMSDPRAETADDANLTLRGRRVELEGAARSRLPMVVSHWITWR